MNLTHKRKTPGGQKQRVALARACYAKTDLVLLDDVFSALDADTAGKVFDGLFSVANEREGILRNAGVVLVTHAEHFLPRVDKILAMVRGEPTFFGTYEELRDFAGSNESTAAIVDFNSSDNEGDKQKKKASRLRKDGTKEEDGIIMTVEERNYGVSSFVDWATWFINAGGTPFILSQLVFIVLDRGLFVLSDWWLSQWSDSAYKELELARLTIPPQTDGRDAQVQYVSIYCTIVFLSVVATSLRSYWMCKSICCIFTPCSLCFKLSSQCDLDSYRKCPLCRENVCRYGKTSIESSSLVL